MASETGFFRGTETDWTSFFCGIWSFASLLFWFLVELIPRAADTRLVEKTV